MNTPRTSGSTLVCTLACVAALAAAAAAGAADAPAQAASRPAAKPNPAAQQRADRAKGMALATETVQRISESQLKVADRVLTGDAACEFGQHVSVEPLAGHAGHFRVRHNKAVYTMVPEDTSTGAVRLEDKKAGMVWLQIPSKSMLMNAKLGQRVVDGCMHPEQRAAVSAVEGAAKAASQP
ncbi:MAG: hypothetical protein U1E89_00960 [Burkholderiaceae bacterium]